MNATTFAPVAVVASKADQATAPAVLELQASELMLVGGGTGAVLFL